MMNYLQWVPGLLSLLLNAFNVGWLIHRARTRINFQVRPKTTRGGEVFHVVGTNLGDSQILIAIERLLLIEYTDGSKKWFGPKWNDAVKLSESIDPRETFYFYLEGAALEKPETVRSVSFVDYSGKVLATKKKKHLPV
jgi:hypothetical protein